MSRGFSSQKKGISSDPAESNSMSGAPDIPFDKQTKQEGGFRNVTGEKEDRKSFDEDYEVKREEEITNEEAGSENDKDQ